MFAHGEPSIHTTPFTHLGSAHNQYLGFRGNIYFGRLATTAMGDPACYRDYCPECDLEVTITDEECPECGTYLPQDGE